MRESYIESKVCDYAKLKGILPYKFSSPNRKNVPDRMFVCSDTFVFFIEFKATGKKPTAGQLREIKRLRSKGQLVFVVDNIENGKQIIDEILSASLPIVGHRLYQIKVRFGATV